jgi:hypothetical protein
MVNVERIREKLKEFEKATPIPCEICGRLPCGCELLQHSFWGGEETAEEEERKMIEGPLDEIHGSPELQEKIHDVNSEECEKDL